MTLSQPLGQLGRFVTFILQMRKVRPTLRAGLGDKAGAAGDRSTGMGLCTPSGGRQEALMLTTPRARQVAVRKAGVACGHVQSWPPGRGLCWSPSLRWAKLQCPLVIGPGDRPDPSR